MTDESLLELLLDLNLKRAADEEKAILVKPWKLPADATMCLNLR